jgi:hypothetical protein
MNDVFTPGSLLVTGKTHEISHNANIPFTALRAYKDAWCRPSYSFGLFVICTPLYCPSNPQEEMKTENSFAIVPPPNVARKSL